MYVQNNIYSKTSLPLLFLSCLLFALRFTMTISSTGIVETALKIQNKRRKIQAIMIYVTKYENDVMENATPVNIYSVYYSVARFCWGILSLDVVYPVLRTCIRLMSY